VLSELKMYTDKWSEVVNMVQSVERPEQFLVDEAEQEDADASLHWTRGTTPLALMLKNNVPVNAPLVFIKAQKLMEVEKLSKAMTEIHAQVAEKATRDHKAAIRKHNDKKHVRSPNFRVGDYVLVAEHRKSGRSKSGQVEGPAPRRECGV
jgi:hypothetical protein